MREVSCDVLLMREDVYKSIAKTEILSEEIPTVI